MLIAVLPGMRVTTKSGKQVHVKQIVNTAEAALFAARRQRLSIVVVPGAAWLVTERLAQQLEAEGYQVIS